MCCDAIGFPHTHLFVFRVGSQQSLIFPHVNDAPVVSHLQQPLFINRMLVIQRLPFRPFDLIEFFPLELTLHICCNSPQIHPQAAPAMSAETATIQPSQLPLDGTHSGDLRGHFFASDPDNQALRSKNTNAFQNDDVMADCTPPERPTIAFQPTAEDYAQRSRKLASARAASGLPPPSLPDGFPARINGPRAWSGRDLDSLDRFTVVLSEEDVVEIEAALEHFKRTPSNNPNSPPLPPSVALSRR